MPVFRETEFTAEVIWLGHVPGERDSIRADAAAALDLTFDGIAGGRHAGALRPSCSRVLNLHPRDTEIRNTRQLSILSEEELTQIAARMDLDAIDPQWLGANIVLRGVPDFSHVPPSSRLLGADGATITVDMENRPCQFPAREIESDMPGHGKAFRSAAKGRRGVVAWVERPGRIALGDRMKLFVPDQPVWRP